MARGRRGKSKNNPSEEKEIPSHREKKLNFDIRERIVPGSFLAVIPFAAEAIENMLSVDYDEVPLYKIKSDEDIKFPFIEFESPIPAPEYLPENNELGIETEFVPDIDAGPARESSISDISPIENPKNRPSIDSPDDVDVVPQERNISPNIPEFFAPETPVDDPAPTDPVEDPPMEEENLPPVADLDVDSVVGQGVPVIFDASNSFDLDGEITRYTFNFGDGNTYTESLTFAPDGNFDGIVNYTYNDAGAVQVSVTVFDNEGASDTVFQNITVQNDTPIFLDPGDTDPTTPGIEDSVITDPPYTDDDPLTAAVEGGLDAVKNDGSQNSLDNIVQENTDWTAIANAYDTDGTIANYLFWIDENQDGNFGVSEFAGISTTGELGIDASSFALLAGETYSMKVTAFDDTGGSADSIDTFSVNSAPIFLDPGDTDPTTPGIEDPTITNPPYTVDDPGTTWIEGSLDAVKNDGSDVSEKNIVANNSDWTAIANAYDEDGNVDKYEFWIQDETGSYVYAGDSTNGEVGIVHSLFSFMEGETYQMKVEATDDTGGVSTSFDEFTVNSAPLANDDLLSMDENTVLEIQASDLLLNDTDVDGNSLSIIANTTVSNGILAFDGIKFTYTPNTDFNGNDSFTYTVSDGQGGTSSATVTISVSDVADPPVGNDDTATTNEDVAVDIDVLANDTDGNNDPLNIDSVTQGTNGSVSVNPDDTIKYTPDPDFHGVDTFTYTVADGNGGFDTATVAVTVNPTNDPFTGGIDAVAVPSLDPADVDEISLGDNLDFDIDVADIDGIASYTYDLNGNTGTVTDVAALKSAINPLGAGLTVGTHILTVTVEDALGNTQDFTDTIDVLSPDLPPVVALDAVKDDGGDPLTISNIVQEGNNWTIDATGSDPDGGLIDSYLFYIDLDQNGTFETLIGASTDGEIEANYLTLGLSGGESYDILTVAIDDEGDVATDSDTVQINAKPVITLDADNATNPNLVPVSSDWTAKTTGTDSDGTIDKFEFWIDLNQDGDYDDANEYIGEGLANGEINIVNSANELGLTVNSTYNMKSVATDDNGLESDAAFDQFRYGNNSAPLLGDDSNQNASGVFFIATQEFDGYGGYSSFNTDIFSTNADGSEVINLTGGGSVLSDVDDIRWARNGSGFFFTGDNASGTRAVFYANEDGSGLIELSSTFPFDSGGNELSPAISADGQYISYMSEDFNTGEIGLVVARTDGGQLLTFNSDNGFDFDSSDFQYFQWSPVEGDYRLSYLRDDGLIESVFVLDPLTATETLLTGATDANGNGFDWSPDGDQIVVKAANDLWAVNVDGLPPVLTNITNTPSLSENPDNDTTNDEFELTSFNTEFNWTPDGDFIVFEDNDGIKVVATDGSGVTTLISDELDVAPDIVVWSPDNTQIAFEANNHVYVGLSDGSGQIVQITDTPATWNITEIAWSPDGTQIAYINNTSSSASDVWVANADGTGSPVQISTTPTTEERDLNWSADSSTVSYTSVNPSIYVAAADQSSAPLKITDSTDPYGTRLSPDGSKVAWQDGSSILVANTDGSNQITLTTNAFDNSSNNSYFVWSPDNSQILFKGETGTGDDLFVINVDGTNQIQITNTATVLEEHYGFSPDGSVVSFVINDNSTGDDFIYTAASDGTSAPSILYTLTNDIRQYGTVGNIIPFVINEIEWSDDGSKLAFLADATAQADSSFIYLIDSDGSNKTLVFGNEDDAYDTPLVESIEFSADNQSINFNFGYDYFGNFRFQNIASADIDGSESTSPDTPLEVFFDIEETQSLQVSPDGTKVAFSGGSDWAAREVFVMNIDGSGIIQNVSNTPLTANSYGELEWSPDSQSLLFAESDNQFANNTKIPTVVHLNDIDNPISLPGPEEISSFYSFGWTPDGSAITFNGYREDLIVMGLDGEVDARFSILENDISISPDGSKVAFYGEGNSSSETGTNLYDISSGTNDFIAPNKLASSSHFSASPDGDKIAFLKSEGYYGYYDVFVVDSNGENLTQLADDVRMDGYNSNRAIWSPDGENVLFHGYYDGYQGAYLYKADGSNANDSAGDQYIFNIDSNDWDSISWSPDSQKIIFEGYFNDGYNGFDGVNISDTSGNLVNVLNNNESLSNTRTHWSSDGSQAVFLPGYYDSYNKTFEADGYLYKVNSDGSGLEQLSEFFDDLAQSFEVDQVIDFDYDAKADELIVMSDQGLYVSDIDGNGLEILPIPEIDGYDGFDENSRHYGTLSNGSILYTANNDLYLTQRDGTIIQVTDTPDDTEYNILLSLDESKIAFSDDSSSYSSRNIFVAALDGSGTTKVNTFEFEFDDLGWTNDGRVSFVVDSPIIQSGSLNSDAARAVYAASVDGSGNTEALLKTTLDLSLLRYQDRVYNPITDTNDHYFGTSGELTFPDSVDSNNRVYDEYYAYVEAGETVVIELEGVTNPLIEVYDENYTLIGTDNSEVTLHNGFSTGALYEYTNSQGTLEKIFFRVMSSDQLTEDSYYNIYVSNDAENGSSPYFDSFNLGLEFEGFASEGTTDALGESYTLDEDSFAFTTAGIDPSINSSIRAGGSNTINLLDNDTDPDGDILTLTEINGSSFTVGDAITLSYGSLIVNSDNTVTYQALSTEEDQIETFTYTVADPYGESATATVTLEIEGVNLSPTATNDGTFTTNEDISLNIPVSSLLSNDTDPEDDPLSIFSFDSGSLYGGQIALAPDGNTLIYTPKEGFNFNGLEGNNNGDGTLIDTFKYTIDDGFGGQSTASVSINVTPINDNPVAFDDLNDKILINKNGGIYVGDPLDPDNATFLADGKSGVWSPDGTQIAFITSDGDIAYMNADGSDVTIIQDLSEDTITYTQRTNNDDILNPGWIDVEKVAAPEYGDIAWSPDGLKIAFVEEYKFTTVFGLLSAFSSINVSETVYSIDVVEILPDDSHIEYEVVRHRDYSHKDGQIIFDINWTPDGNQIYYGVKEPVLASFSENIWFRDLPIVGGFTPDINGFSNDIRPVFHDDGGGGKAAFVSSMIVNPVTEERETFLFVSDADGSNATAIAPLIALGGSDLIHWDVDGEEIILTGGKVIDAATGIVSNLDYPEIVTIPLWSDDGTRFAFVGDDPGGTERHLYVANGDLTDTETVISATLLNTGVPVQWTAGGDELILSDGRAVNIDTGAIRTLYTEEFEEVIGSSSLHQAPINVQLGNPTIFDVLSNDTDVDTDDTQIIISTSTPEAVINPDGTITFTGTSSGLQVFTYILEDELGATSTGHVTVFVFS